MYLWTPVINFFALLGCGKARWGLIKKKKEPLFSEPRRLDPSACCPQEKPNKELFFFDLEHSRLVLILSFSGQKLYWALDVGHLI